MWSVLLLKLEVQAKLLGFRSVSHRHDFSIFSVCFPFKIVILGQKQPDYLLIFRFFFSFVK